MPTNNFFTSESVTEGHPDKIADAISMPFLMPFGEGPIRTSRLRDHGHDRPGLIAGEITTNTYVDMPAPVRKTIEEIGHRLSMGFDSNTCAVLTAIDKQSADISMGVTAGEGLHAAQGAGDQGMFGFANSDTDVLAHAYRVLPPINQATDNG